MVKVGFRCGWKPNEESDTEANIRKFRIVQTEGPRRRF
jgi:hypothetical protein